MYGKLVFVTGGLAALTACPGAIPGTGGCDTAGVCDSGDTVVSTGDLVITEVHEDCETDSWWYYAWTNGWTTDGVLSISQDTDPAWTEQHNLPSNLGDGECADGSCDYLEQYLTVVTSAGAQVADSTSLFQCTGGMPDTMGWRIDIYDLDGNFADCAVFGNDGAISGGTEPLDAAGDCADADTW